MHQVAWRFHAVLPSAPSRTVDTRSARNFANGDEDMPMLVIDQLRTFLAEHNAKSILPAVSIRLGYGVRFALQCEMLAGCAKIENISGKDAVLGLPITETINDCVNAVEFY